MKNKVFQSIDQQIDILRSRGLNITDEKQARTFLLHNNYYRISGYSLTLRKNDIVNLTKKYPFVRMKYYGFRCDWIAEL